MPPTPCTQEMLVEMKNSLFPPVHATPALHKIDSEEAWDNTQSFSQPYKPSARVRKLEKMMGVDEVQGSIKEQETMPMSSLQMMVCVGFWCFWGVVFVGGCGVCGRMWCLWDDVVFVGGDLMLSLHIL